jgi:hypothetical protein
MRELKPPEASHLTVCSAGVQKQQAPLDESFSPVPVGLKDSQESSKRGSSSVANRQLSPPLQQYLGIK